MAARRAALALALVARASAQNNIKAELWYFANQGSYESTAVNNIEGSSSRATRYGKYDIAAIDFYGNYRPTVDGYTYNNHFVARFTGKFRAPSSGSATFWTTSDDGSFLYINNQLVVSNGGYHGRVQRSGSYSIVQGTVYSFEVRLFQGGGGVNIKVWWQPPGSGTMLLRGNCDCDWENIILELLAECRAW